MKRGCHLEKGIRNFYLKLSLTQLLRKSHLHNFNKNCHVQKIPPEQLQQTPICIIAIKIVAHIFAAETVTYISVAESSDLIIAKEIVTCINCNRKIHQNTCNGKYHLKTYIYATVVVTCIHLHNCYRKFQFHSSNRSCHRRRIDYRNFHQQKWCQSVILLVAIKN